MKMGSEEVSTKIKNYDHLVEIAPKHATVFFGDSITDLCPIEDLYAPYVEKSGTSVINRGISSEKTASMLGRIEKEIIPLQPKNLVMLMGINDIFEGREPEEIKANIEKMIQLMQTKSPDTHLILQAIYPINEADRDTFYEKMMMKGNGNQSVKETNILLKELAAQYDITYLNMNDKLIDENGNLKHEYAYDGLHPNTAGYLVIRDEVMKVLH